MLNNSDVDVIYIPYWHPFRNKLAIIKSGKHVWCEKPLTCDYEDTKKLIHLARKKNLMLAGSLMYLYHPQFKKVCNFVNDSNP